MRTGHRLQPVAEGFHATPHDIKGKTILPSAAHGRQVFDISSRYDTYFTPIPQEGVERTNPMEPATRSDAEDVAWNWGQMIHSQVRSVSDRPRMRVHVTEPAEEQYLDGNGTYYGARVSPTQTIKDTIWTPPAVHQNAWVEGTLPHVNWHQFGGANWTTHSLEGMIHHIRPEGLPSRSVVREALDGPDFTPRKPEIPGQETMLP